MCSYTAVTGGCTLWSGCKQGLQQDYLWKHKQTESKAIQLPWDFKWQQCPNIPVHQNCLCPWTLQICTFTYSRRKGFNKQIGFQPRPRLRLCMSSWSSLPWNLTQIERFCKEDLEKISKTSCDKTDKQNEEKLRGLNTFWMCVCVKRRKIILMIKMFIDTRKSWRRLRSMNSWSMM